MADDSKTLELQIRIAAQEAVRVVSSLKGEIQTLSAEAKKLSDSDGQAVANTFKQVQATAEKAAASMKLFGTSSSELRQVQAQLKNAAAELVAKGFDPQSEEIKKLIEEYKRLGKEAAGLDEANGANVNSFGDLKRAITSLAEVAAALKVLSIIKDMGAFALKTADDFQTMKNQFGVLLGDMEAGAGLFNEIKAFNDKTPFDMSTLTQATNVLIAAKVPLQDLQAQLTKFGDLAQGNSQRLTSYIHAYSIAAAKGKADTQVLNTYLNQGVPILGALAKQFKTTEAEVLSMASNGEIAFADFTRALEELAAEGGMYFGGMELASQSLAAMQEGLQEAVNSLAASFGDMLLPAATAIVRALTGMANAINDSPLLKGLFAGALVAIAVYLTAVAAKAAIAFAAQMALNFAWAATNPVIMATTVAAAALAAGYVAVSAKTQKATRDQEDFALALQKSVRAVDDWETAMRGMSMKERSAGIMEAAAKVAELSSAIERAHIEIAKYRADATRYRATYDREIKREQKRLAELEQLLQEAKKNLQNAFDAAQKLKDEEPPPKAELPPSKRTIRRRRPPPNSENAGTKNGGASGNRATRLST